MKMTMYALDGEYDCPSCGTDEGNNIFYFDKDDHGDSFKRCLTCEKCGQEWTEWEDYC